MKLMKFEGATIREALAKVKAELGDQAMVVSTRQVRRGLLGTAYEVSAAVEPDLDAARPPASPPVSTMSHLAQRTVRAAGPAPAPAAIPEASVELAELRSELRSLRAMVRAASDGRGTDELRGEVATLRRALDELRATTPSGPALAELARAPGLVMRSTARVLAVIGATGVGKTTTIAKLATRAALVDRERVAIVTLDNYRVGGIDQIRTFAELIGVPLIAVDHAIDLPEHVDDLASYDRVFIDTAGQSPLDGPAIAELARVLNRVTDLEVHLAITAATTGLAIDDQLRRYAVARPRRLLFTKLDETSPAPELVRAPARAGIAVSWVTTGQAVPEDIEAPTAPRLLELATRGLAPGIGSGTRTHSTAA